MKNMLTGYDRATIRMRFHVWFHVSDRIGSSRSAENFDKNKQIIHCPEHFMEVLFALVVSADRLHRAFNTMDFSIKRIAKTTSYQKSIQLVIHYEKVEQKLV